MRTFHFHRYVFGNRSITAIDKMMAVAAVVQPLMTTPQIISIFSSRDVSGVSLLTWASYLIIGTVFLAYAIAHNIKPLIVTQILWLLVDLLVVVGVLLYR